MIETLASLSGGINMPSLSASFGRSGHSHDGASLIDKNMARWMPAKGSADADLLPDLDLLVSRTRDLGRNNGLASGAQQTLVDNIVGTGGRVSSIPDYRALGKDKAWAEEFSNQAEAIWRTWADSTLCDAAEQLTFAGMTSLVLRSGIMNGEALGLPLWIPGTRSQWNTRILLVEPDRLSNPQDVPDQEFRRGGIEIDQWGRALAYWIRKNHPGDWLAMLASMNSDWERIPAEADWGRKRVIHVHDKERTGQTRGKPWFTPILAQFKMLDQYQRAELKSAIVSALAAVFIQTPLDTAALANLLGADPTSPEYTNWLTVMKQYVAPLDGGAIIPLPPGTTPIPFDPSRPSTSFDPFVTSLNRYMAVGLNMPYELFTKDFSKTNYSSARAALLEAWRNFKSRRQWLATAWIAPCYSLVIEEAVMTGRLDAPNFYENQPAYTRCKWIGPGKGWIDPVKEAQAARERVDGYLSTLEDECAEQGADWQEVLHQRAREIALMTELKLPMNPVTPQKPAGQPTQEDLIPA